MVLLTVATPFPTSEFVLKEILYSYYCVCWLFYFFFTYLYYLIFHHNECPTCPGLARNEKHNKQFLCFYMNVRYHDMANFEVIFWNLDAS